MVTLLTLLLWVVSLVLSPLFPPSLPGDCFTRRAYDILCMLSALLYKIIGKTFFFFSSRISKHGILAGMAAVPSLMLLPFLFDVARSGVTS